MVFSVDKKSKKILATIQNGDRIDRYECSLLSCDNPICNCGSVYLSFYRIFADSPSHAGTVNDIPTYTVDVDIMQRKLWYKDEEKIPDVELEFANLLLSSLDDSDLEFLWKGYFAFKNEKTESEETESEIINSVEDRFDYVNVEENGLMYEYNAILPFGDQLIFNLNGKQYLIYDQYCLLPKCSCTDTTLTIIFAEKYNKPGEELCSINLNYKQNKWEIFKQKNSSIGIEDIKLNIEEQIPDIYNRFLSRHIKLKRIYAGCKKKHFAQMQQVSNQKTGRNAPCPCGSGKKFKKCCLRKSN